MTIIAIILPFAIISFLYASIAEANNATNIIDAITIIEIYER